MNLQGGEKLVVNLNGDVREEDSENTKKQLLYDQKANSSTGYSSKDSQSLQQDFDNDEEYESRKGVASYIQKWFRKKPTK